MGKGRKERIVPLGGKCVAALEAWLALRPLEVNARTGKQDDRAVFLSARGARLNASLGTLTDAHQCSISLGRRWIRVAGLAPIIAPG